MRKVSLLALLVVCLAAPMMADIAYSNLGNPPFYDCCNGWTVGGDGSPVGRIDNAQQFTSLTSGTVSQIDVALGWVTGGTPGATIQLWTSVNDLPGIMLGSGTVSNLPVFGQTSSQVATITGDLGSITAGQQYFVVVLADQGAWEAWNWNTQGDIGLLLQGDGTGWNSFPGNTLGAFDVITGGGGVPEPGTLVMLGTGVLGLAGAIRRKLF